MVLHKLATAITRADIEQLISDQEQEGQRLDYKETLPEKGDRREFLKHVAGFANTTGGLIVFGVREKRDENGKPTGVPEEGPPCGIGFNVDDFFLRLASGIRDSITPQLVPQPEIVSVPGFDPPVVIVRIPRSFAKPHMVHERFYARQGSQTVPLRVEQIRDEFLESGLIAERIRDFRADRLARIVTGETPVRLANPANFVLHICPFSSFAERTEIELQKVHGQVYPPSQGGFDSRYNLDGALSYLLEDRNTARSYIQVFRSGCFEFVSTEALKERPDRDFPLLLINTISAWLVCETPKFLDHLKGAGVQYPVFLMVSLIGTRGARAKFHPDASDYSKSMEENQALLPEVVLQEEPEDWGESYRRTLDTIWQCVGHSKCTAYMDGMFQIPEGYR